MNAASAIPARGITPVPGDGSVQGRGRLAPPPIQSCHFVGILIAFAIFNGVSLIRARLLRHVEGTNP